MNRVPFGLETFITIIGVNKHNFQFLSHLLFFHFSHSLYVSICSMTLKSLPNDDWSASSSNESISIWLKCLLKFARPSLLRTVGFFSPHFISIIRHLAQNDNEFCDDKLSTSTQWLVTVMSSEIDVWQKFALTTHTYIYIYMANETEITSICHQVTWQQ